jgi:hypothetical protein
MVHVYLSGALRSPGPPSLTLCILSWLAEKSISWIVLMYISWIVLIRSKDDLTLEFETYFMIIEALGNY